jgi:hypothetical protein
MTTDANIVGSQFVGVTASGGEFVVLAGDTGDYSGGTTRTTAANTYGLQYVAVATGTLTNGYWYSYEIDTSDSRMVVYNSADSKIATSDLLGTTLEGTTEYAFSGDQQVTITSGQTYRICIAPLAAINTKAGGTNTIPWADAYNPPPASFVADGSDDWGPWQMYIKGNT